jgi:dihydrofolate reductase
MSPVDVSVTASGPGVASAQRPPRVTLVVAVAANGVMGADNQLPWRLPADLKRFKELTMGRPIVMGRKTYDSIGRPLPGRENIVVSRQPGLRIDGCVVVDSVEAAFAVAAHAAEIAVIGGADIFRLALPRADTIHLTRVHAQIAGDVYFPSLDAGEWEETVVAHHAADERHAYSFSFVELNRKRSA